jgi:hypothetical protein
MVNLEIFRPGNKLKKEKLIGNSGKMENFA